MDTTRYTGGGTAGGDPIRDGGGMTTLLIACALTVALWFVPYAAFLTYPIRLLVTFLHEGGHALAALLTGGVVDFIKVFPDGSGVTGTRGGLEIAIVSAGYLGATLYGAALIALVRRRARGRTLLLLTGVSIALLTLAFIRPWANLFGFAWGVALAGGLIVAGLYLAERAAEWTAAFVGVQCALNALFDLRTLLNLSWGQPLGGPATDAVLMSRILPLPPVVWSVFWIALSAALLWLVLRPARPQP